MTSVLNFNDWRIDKFFFLIFIIQITFLAWVLFESVGFQVPLIRQILGLFYLLFVPGALLLRILKFHNIETAIVILYSVGLSLATLMFFGLLINTLGSLKIIANPISTSTILLSLLFLVSFLSVLCYIRDRRFKANEMTKINFKLFIKPITLILIFIPFVSIIGTYLMNIYGLNIILLILLVIIGILIVFAGFKGIIPNELHEIAIFSIAISLLLQTTLISNYLWGWDIQFEYFSASLVLTNSFWNSQLSGLTNSTLSIVMLLPIFSKVLSLNLIWVLKIIYPLIYALMPIGLYNIYKKQFGPKIAILASLFFMSFVVFYVEMMQLAREQIAEFFLVLMLLVLFNQKINNVNTSIVLVIFAFAMIVSHYGTAYLFILVLIFVLALSFLSDKFSNYGSIFNILKKEKVTLNFVFLIIVFSLAWYMIVSDSSSLNQLVGVGNNIATNIADLFSPNSAQGTELILSQQSSLIHSLGKYVELRSQVFILIGILAVLKFRNSKLSGEYFNFSIAALILLILSIAVPNFQVQ